jgi:uracil-DNA glycosylase
MLVGEQPGDGEDRAGRPFVGPAGRLLDRALEEAEEIHACRPWLDAELAAVRPRVLVLLGATAAKALLGSGFRVSRQRGELLEGPLAQRVLATVHPSSILRAPDAEARALAYKGFVADLKVVADELGHG